MRKILLLLLCCGLAGCPPPAVPPPEESTPSLEADEAVALVLARRDLLSAVRARVPAELNFGGHEISTDLALILQRPSRVRADALGLFGPLVMIALDGDRLTAFDTTGDRHLSGRYPEGAARAQLPIPPPRQRRPARPADGHSAGRGTRRAARATPLGCGARVSPSPGAMPRDVASS